MNADKHKNVYGELRETGEVKVIDGIRCEVVKLHFPVDKTDGKWRWYDAYRFTVPGWDECTITGLAAARRVIRGRTDPAVLNTLGINLHADSKEKKTHTATMEREDTERISVLDIIREYRDMPQQPRMQPERDNKAKPSERDI